MYLSKTLCPSFALGLGGVAFFFAHAAHAQGLSVLTGSVVDASNKQPVADVVVSATSPALQGEQVAVTDPSGSYRLAQLPPGEYTVRLEKASYRPYARGGISLRINTAIRFNVELLPEAVKEEIVVVARAPTVDIGSTTTGVTVGPELMSRIALNPPGTRAGAVRSFENLAVIAPGAYADPYGVSMNGATSPENRYQIDGLSVNSAVYGTSDTPLSVEFIKEAQVATGGYLPEFGRATGGVINVLTKTGSNELHGSVFSSITPGALEGPREVVKKAGTSFQMDTKLSALRNLGFEIGGPILKDQLWFYAGTVFALQDESITRRLNRFRYETNADGSLQRNDDDGDGELDDSPIPSIDENGFQRVDPIPGTERVYYASRNTAQYIGKLTWNISPNHTLTLSAYGAPSASGGEGKYSLSPQRGRAYFGISDEIGPGSYTGNGRRETSSIHDTSLNLASSFLEKRLLLDATVGWHHAAFDVMPVDGSALASGKGLSQVPGVLWTRGSPTPHSVTDFEGVPPSSGCEPASEDTEVLFCPAATYRTGGPGFTSESYENRYQGNVVATYLLSALGHHVIKAGMDVETTSHDLAVANTGGIWFMEDWDGTTFSVFRFGSVVSPDEVFVPEVRENTTRSTILGGFVQDSWNILDLVTLNVGVRYDTQVISTSDGTGMALPAQWSPRVGAIYDVTRQGRSKIFASFARYYENVPLDVADLLFVPQPLTVSSVSSSVCDPDDPAKRAACEAPENRLNRGEPYEPNRKWIIYGGNRAPVDPDLEPQSSDEIQLGGEYEIFEDARVGVTYTHRSLNYVVEDMSRDRGTTFFIGNPGYGATSNFPKARRDYDAVTLAFQKAFSTQWLAQASYTLSYLRGNYAGLFSEGSDFPTPNHSTNFDLIELTPNTDGPLPGDHTHQIKVYGAKEFSLPGPAVVNVGLTYQGLSGAPLNVLSAHPLFGSGGGAFLLPRGEGGRLPWVHTIDSNISVGYRLSKASVLSVSLDVFNLFNFQAVTARDQEYTRAIVRPIEGGKMSDLPSEGEALCEAGAPCRYKLVNSDGTPFNPKDRNPNYGNPTAYQSPRQFRIGAKVTF